LRTPWQRSLWHQPRQKEKIAKANSIKCYPALRHVGSLDYAHSLLSCPIHSHFSSKVPDPRSNQIQSTHLFHIHYDKLLHSYPVHIILNTA
jgi:hypothetical protein